MQIPKLVCPKCSHEWVPRIENPVLCPKCKHRLDARINKRTGVSV